MTRQPVPTDIERRAVDRAAAFLARELRDALADFGDLPPHLAPAVMLSALLQATPDLIEQKHAATWPGSLSDHRRWMAEAARALAATASQS